MVAAQVLGQAAQRRLERQRAARGQNAEDLLQPLARLELVARPFEQRRQLLGARGAKLVAFAPDVDEGQAAEAERPAQRGHQPAKCLEGGHAGDQPKSDTRQHHRAWPPLLELGFGQHLAECFQSLGDRLADRLSTACGPRWHEPPVRQQPQTEGQQRRGGKQPDHAVRSCLG